MVRSAGLELAASSFGGKRSIQLSYERINTRRQLSPSVRAARFAFMHRQPIATLPVTCRRQEYGQEIQLVIDERSIEFAHMVEVPERSLRA